MNMIRAAFAAGLAACRPVARPNSRTICASSVSACRFRRCRPAAMAASPVSPTRETASDWRDYQILPGRIRTAPGRQLSLCLTTRQEDEDPGRRPAGETRSADRRRRPGRWHQDRHRSALPGFICTRRPICSRCRCEPVSARTAGPARKRDRRRRNSRSAACLFMSIAKRSRRPAISSSTASCSAIPPRICAISPMPRS